MSLAFSRRSFLKYSAVAAVAVAGAGLFSGCDQTDTKNLYCDGAGSITVLQINAVLGTYDDNAKKYKDIDLTKNPHQLPLPDHRWPHQQSAHPAQQLQGDRLR